MPLQTTYCRAVMVFLVALITLVGGSSQARAQTATPTALRDVTIAVTVVGRTTRLSAEIVGLPVQNRLQTDFARAGFRVPRAPPDTAQLWVQLTPNADQTLTVDLMPGTSILPELPSSIAMSVTTPITFTGPQDDAFVQTISRITLALTIALLGDCVSTPILPADLSESDISLVSGAIDFYAGNCNLTAGETASAHYLDALDSLEQPGVPFSARIAPSVNLAWVAYQQERPQVALDTLDKLLDAATEPADRVLILRKRSALLALDFRFADAIADVKAAIELSPNDPSLYLELGQRILLTYEWDQVLDAYNRAIEIDPSYAPAYFQRGILFYTEGPRANALKDFQKYLELAPDGEFATEASSYIGGIEQTTAGEIQQGK